MNKNIQRPVILLLVFLAIALLVKPVLLQGLQTVKLSPTAQLASAVSVALGPNSGKDSLPAAGRDYTMEDTHYFEGDKWAVTTVKPTGANADTVYVVLEKFNGYYQAVLKPGNLYSSSYFYTLPPELAEYLDQKGALNG